MIKDNIQDDCPVPALLGKKVFIRWNGQVGKKRYTYKIVEYDLSVGLVKVITMGRGRKRPYWIHLGEIAVVSEAKGTD